ncbi:MAG: DUF362 domain-containing protein [Candidatus Bathyarchaeia archaeon]
MASRVAVVKLSRDVQESLQRALKLIGDLNDLNKSDRPLVLKVGVFSHKGVMYPTVTVVDAIIKSFDNSPKIFLAESDNYRGTGLERLQIYRKLFDERVRPFNLSQDTNTRKVQIADEKMELSHVLFKPNVFISTHALRRYDKGTILKNLLGLIPERRKARFHKKLVTVLLDAYEVIGGIDLAIIDATRTYSGPAARKGINTNVLVVGRDAVAVEAVGATLVGLKPEKMPVIQEAMNRGLGEGNVERIEVVGNSIDSLQERFRHL